MGKAYSVMCANMTLATEIRYLYFNILTVKKVSGLSATGVPVVAIEEREARHKVPIGTRLELGL